MRARLEYNIYVLVKAFTSATSSIYFSVKPKRCNSENWDFSDLFLIFGSVSISVCGQQHFHWFHFNMPFHSIDKQFLRKIFQKINFGLNAANHSPAIRFAYCLRGVDLFSFSSKFLSGFGIRKNRIEYANRDASNERNALCSVSLFIYFFIWGHVCLFAAAAAVPFVRIFAIRYERAIRHSTSQICFNLFFMHI